MREFLNQNEKAQKARDLEWGKLWKRKVWDETLIVGYDQVIKDAKSKGKYITSVNSSGYA